MKYNSIYNLYLEAQKEQEARELFFTELYQFLVWYSTNKLTTQEAFELVFALCSLDELMDELKNMFKV